MSIPTLRQIKRPLLQLVADGREFQLRDIVPCLADHFALTEEERREVLPSGRVRRFDNRCGWAQKELKQEGLLVSTRRGYHKITDQGLEVVSQDSIEASDSPSDAQEPCINNGQNGRTPEELIEDNYQIIREQLAIELLQRIRDCSPGFFERLVIALLVQMGYGGSLEDAEAVGRSGDGGIDGIINEDRLGFDIIYVQAKRWEQTVGEQPIRDFVGALQGQRARKGIFITTSKFTQSAKRYVSRIDSRDSKVVLLDGDQLAQLMIDNNVGVSTVRCYKIKRVDSDYFDED